MTEAFLRQQLQLTDWRPCFCLQTSARRRRQPSFTHQEKSVYLYAGRGVRYNIKHLVCVCVCVFDIQYINSLCVEREVLTVHMKLEEFTMLDVFSWRTASFFFTASSRHRASWRVTWRGGANVSTLVVINVHERFSVYLQVFCQQLDVLLAERGESK